MAITRRSSDEISGELANGMALELMALRGHLLAYFNGSRLPDNERDIIMGRALECVENLEEVIKPDLFTSRIFWDDLDSPGGQAL